MTVDYMPDDIDVEKFMLFLQQDNPDHREKHYIPNITNDTIWRFRIMRSRANMDNNEEFLKAIVDNAKPILDIISKPRSLPHRRNNSI